MLSDTDEILTAKHAGLLLDLTSSGVRRLELVGRLRALRDSTGRRLFRRADVERLKEERKQKQAERGQK